MTAIRNHHSRLASRCQTFNALRLSWLVLIFLSLTAQGGGQAPADVSGGIDYAYRLSKGQKGVKVSTDVLLAAMPLATLTGVLIEKDWEGLKQGAFTAVTTLGVTYALKYTVREWRPDRSDRHSFPSGHASSTFATAAFVQRRYGWKLGVPAYVLSTYVAWGRVYSKRHHWWDVVAGAAIGTGSAYIFTTPFARKHELTISPVASPEAVGVYASMVF